MELLQARLGDAIELSEGVYALDALTHCRGAGLEWSVWELAEGPTAGLQLAVVGAELYQVVVTEAQTLPGESELVVDGVNYRQRHQGEARGERDSRAGQREFWLGRYRYFQGEGRMLLFMDVHGTIRRWAGEAMDARVVRIYR